MKAIRRTLLVTLLFVTGLTLMLSLGNYETSAAPARGASDANYLVGLEPNASGNVVQNAGGEVRVEFDLVNVVSANLSPQAAEALQNNPNVRFVEENAEVTALEQTTPWGIDRVFGEESYAFESWGISTGEGVDVAVLDTGIDENHPDLNVVGGVTTVDDSHWGSDGSAHGTHVAGTIGALDNGSGVVGVAPDVNLYAVKVLGDDGGGTLESVILGIEWAVAQDIPIINMSLGSSASSEALEEASDAANDAGSLLVAAAGNEGHPARRGDTVGYPANYESVLAVASSTETDGISGFSSHGPSVEITAPGSNILSTVPGGGYGEMSGTSMASPHVAGVAALLLSADPTLSNDEMRDILTSTAVDLGHGSEDQGEGLVKVNYALAAVDGDSGDEEETVYEVSLSAGDGGSIDPSGTISVTEGDSLTFNVSADDGYEIADVVVDGDSVGAVSSYTIDSLSADTVVEASFEAVEEDDDEDDGEDEDAELSLDASLSTEDDVYSTNSWVYITFTLVDQDGDAVSDASVELEVVDPDGNVVETYSETTNASGQTEVRYRLRRQSTAGVYSVTADARLDDESAQASTSFELE